MAQKRVPSHPNLKTLGKDGRAPGEGAPGIQADSSALELYKRLSDTYAIDLIASGGISSIDDVKDLNSMNIYGAIIGKAYYTKAIDLKEALEVTR